MGKIKLIKKVLRISRGRRWQARAMCNIIHDIYKKMGLALRKLIWGPRNIELLYDIHCEAISEDDVKYLYAHISYNLLQGYPVTIRISPQPENSELAGLVTILNGGKQEYRVGLKIEAEHVVKKKIAFVQLPR